jgi:hypothetical protein
MMHTIAEIVSLIFEPMLVVYVLALLGGAHAGLTHAAWRTYVLVITVFTTVVFAVRLFFKRKDKTNWDISNRKHRIVPLIILLVALGVLYIGIRSWIPQSTASMFAMFMAWALGFLLITLKIKVSGHVGILTLFIGYLVVWYGPVALISVLTIPLLAWSRVTLKRHTIAEVILGCSYSILFVILTRFLL